MSHTRFPVMKIAVWAFVAIFAIIVVFQTVGSVPTNCTGVLKRAGMVQQKGLSEGLFFKIPFVDTVDIISNQVQTSRIACGTKDATTDDTAETKDLQQIPVFEFQIQHQLNPDMSYEIYTNYGTNYAKMLVQDNALAIIKQVFAQYNSEEIASHKGDIPAEIGARLNQITQQYGINIVQCLMKTYNFTDEYNAILDERARLTAELKNNELKQTNEKIAAQTAYDVAVKQAESDAETARIQAEKDKEVAQINADAQAVAAKTKVDSDAYVKTTSAQAEKEARIAIAAAEKAELEAKAAGLNELVIQQAMIEKWDGKLVPNFGGGTGFTFTNLTELVTNMLAGHEE